MRILVSAGPGTGKTEIAALRMADLVRSGLSRPDPSTQLFPEVRCERGLAGCGGAMALVIVCHHALNGGVAHSSVLGLVWVDQCVACSGV